MPFYDAKGRLLEGERGEMGKEEARPFNNG